MIFIFGVQPKTLSRQSGRFHCPVCQNETDYEYRVSRSYASLFFLPLFAFGKEQTMLRCTECGTVLPEKFLPEPQDKSVL